MSIPIIIGIPKETNAFGNGAASYLSRLLGRDDKDTANKVASTALYSSVIIGAILIIIATILLKPILTLLGATDTIMPYALTYARIYIISCIFNVFNVTMKNIVASEGAPSNVKIGLSNIVANIIKILLQIVSQVRNYLLILLLLRS